jgi:ribosome biogenesis protein Nip4
MKYGRNQELAYHRIRLSGRVGNKEIATVFFPNGEQTIVGVRARKMDDDRIIAEKALREAGIETPYYDSFERRVMN